MMRENDTELNCKEREIIHITLNQPSQPEPPISTQLIKIFIAALFRGSAKQQAQEKDISEPDNSGKTGNGLDGVTKMFSVMLCLVLVISAIFLMVKGLTLGAGFVFVFLLIAIVKVIVQGQDRAKRQ
jgi:hypothetical protein